MKRNIANKMLLFYVGIVPKDIQLHSEINIIVLIWFNSMFIHWIKAFGKCVNGNGNVYGFKNGL